MVKDPKISSAISKIRQRTERNEDISKIQKAYVDTGILVQLDNDNHQILFGRRGTGKTHVFQILKTVFEKQNHLSVYIDARTLGSSSQFMDNSVPIHARCASLFKDIFTPIYYCIYEEIISGRAGQESSKFAAENLDILMKCITESPKTFAEEKVIEKTKKESEEGSNVDLKVSGKFVPEIGVGVKSNDKSSAEKETTYLVSHSEKIYFPDIVKYLTEALRLINKKIFVLIDEWSSLPLDIQPYLSEFIKRGMFPQAKCVVKIAALEQRSEFNLKIGGRNVGFELGADISISQDLDDIYVFDKNPDGVSKLYAAILYNHISLELDQDYLVNTYQVNRENFNSRMFTDKNVFNELSRSAEGVIRDLINIFTISFFNASKKQYSKIDKSSILVGSRQWFEQDKNTTIGDDLRIVLNRIISDVLGERKSRSFMIQRSLEKHPSIQRLFDARLIHLVARGYADKENPGLRYNVYTLDYGTYVDMMGTSKSPQMGFDSNGEVGPDFIVPFDDKRSIRRIILKEEMLSNS